MLANLAPSLSLLFARTKAVLKDQPGLSGLVPNCAGTESDHAETTRTLSPDSLPEELRKTPRWELRQ